MKLLSVEKRKVIDSHIPEATRYADQYVKNAGGNPKDVVWSVAWSRAYHRKMDELCKEAGVRK